MLESMYVTAFPSQPKQDNTIKPFKAGAESSDFVFNIRVNKNVNESNPSPGRAQACAMPPLKT